MPASAAGSPWADGGRPIIEDGGGVVSTRLRDGCPMMSPGSPAGSTDAVSAASDTAPQGLPRAGGQAAAAVVVVQAASAAAWLIPISGLALVLFLVVHLAGVSLALLDPMGFEQLADVLHRQPWLPPLEVALAAALLLHPLLALLRSASNRRARGAVAGPQRSRRDGGLEAAAALAGRWAPWSGASWRPCSPPWLPPSPSASMAWPVLRWGFICCRATRAPIAAWAGSSQPTGSGSAGPGAPSP